jgi:hypothetical protein
MVHRPRDLTEAQWVRKALKTYFSDIEKMKRMKDGEEN